MPRALKTLATGLAQNTGGRQAPKDLARRVPACWPPTQTAIPRASILVRLLFFYELFHAGDVVRDIDTDGVMGHFGDADAVAIF